MNYDPTNPLIIESKGSDEVRVGSATSKLERYSIDGVVWGRETVWLDDRGALAAAITRAGGLSFEAVREDLEPALVGFVQRATRDRIADLEAITQRNPHRGWADRISADPENAQLYRSAYQAALRVAPDGRYPRFDLLGYDRSRRILDATTAETAYIRLAVILRTLVRADVPATRAAAEHGGRKA